MSTPIDGPVLRTAKMHLVTPASPVAARVVKNHRCTASPKAAGFVRHIEFDVAATPLANSFISGQSFGVLPPGHDANLKPHKLRLYSLASPTAGEDGRGTIVATTVKRLIDEHWDTHHLHLGVASNYLCNLQPGDSVQLTGPSGKRFVLPLLAHDFDYVFIATGTGIAPFRGMIADLLTPPPAAIHESPASRTPTIALLMGSPYATDLLYHEHFQALAAKHPSFHYITALSRESQPDHKPPMYVHDRITHTQDLLRPLLASDRTLIYICGIAGMELGVLQRLATTLPAPALQRYLDADADTIAAPQSWTRAMLHKQVRPTRNVFMEVY